MPEEARQLRPDLQKRCRLVPLPSLPLTLSPRAAAVLRSHAPGRSAAHAPLRGVAAPAVAERLREPEDVAPHSSRTSLRTVACDRTSHWWSGWARQQTDGNSSSRLPGFSPSSLPGGSHRRFHRAHWGFLSDPHPCPASTRLNPHCHFHQVDLWVTLFAGLPKPLKLRSHKEKH